MKVVLLRIASVVTALFTLGHSSGTFREPHGAQVPVATVMRSVHFGMFGSERTFWDMFHGYAVLFIFVGAYLAIVLWLWSRAPPARSVLLLTAGLQVAFAAISFADFFWAPGVFNAVSAACVAAAALR